MDEEMESRICNCLPPPPPDTCDSKTFCPKTWPELVGFSGEVAAEVIKAEMPIARIEFIVGPPWAYTQELIDNRVRIAVDRSNKVVIPPPTVG